MLEAKGMILFNACAASLLDSNEAQAIGYQKKSERKRPKRQAAYPSPCH